MFPEKNIPNHWKFVTKILHAIARLYLLYLKSPKFYLTISNFDSYAVWNVTILWIFRFYSKKMRKIVIYRRRYDRSPRNLAQWCRMGHSSASALKIVYLKSPR